jgi:hypothetical protein
LPFKNAAGFRRVYGGVFLRLPTHQAVWGNMEQRSNANAVNRLLSILGEDSASGPNRAGLEYSLQWIKRGYEDRWPRATSAAAARRKPLLQKMLKNNAERRRLRRLLGQEYKQEIRRAAGIRLNSRPFVEAVIEQREPPKPLHPYDPELVEALEELEDQDIRFLLDETRDAYRKTPMRAHLIEPFLVFLETNHLWEKAHPMTDVMEALFDFVGVEKKYRLTDPGIRTIVREFKRDVVPVLKRVLGHINHR